MRLFIYLLFLLNVTNINSQEKASATYFPPNEPAEWATTNFEAEGWKTPLKDKLYHLLEQENTRAFIVLKEGKILIEEYWGKNFRGADFDKHSYWYWASAGKSLTACLIGIAEQQGLLSLEDPTSQYLGSWTSMPQKREDAIKIKHQLTMTTGLDYTVNNKNCTTADCLKFKAMPGKQWYYHNAPYTLLRQVLETASGHNINQYTQDNIISKIGADGFWKLTKNNNNLYLSTPRSAARFGLLILNRGIWDEQVILKDKNYFEQMTSTSQSINPSYGYLWWLNGKSEIIIPTMTNTIQQDLVPSAPQDMISALGKNGQIIDVVPSKHLVIVRMGEKPNDGMSALIFHRKFWNILHEMIPD
ncbi:serine hydrolase domain-containing protein [Mesohalobacter halotolerans]|uniref:Serine hydrolase n=1 Tax=Mesohalobacter halotolerans TaxID=1883405 RepID=A0A4V6AML9_9FLAO|nr:serine hydrolase [Mesohalobacter halotolerans]TKS56905.1 serine hydrolase [Mesohalobacter halotolerans]